MTVCGTGGWAGPLPGDPGEVFGLSATPAFGGIQLAWNFPGINPQAIAYVTVYRGFFPEFQYAIKKAEVAGDGYFDQTGLGETLSVKYYWVQVMSVNGTLGALIGPASATARPTIDQTIEMLSERIDEGLLATTLRSKIGEISLLGNSITGEVQNRLAQNQALSGLMLGLNNDLATGLVIIEQVRNKQINDNNVLVEALELFAAGIGDSVAGVSEEVMLWVNTQSAVASKITTVESTVNGNTATGEVGLTTTVGLHNNKLVDIGARWTAIVQVETDGTATIGGFGIYNNGTTVQAGFDVDSFWIGRTTNRKKPFIVDVNGEVIIDKAVIGTLTADQIDATGLVVRDKLTGIILLDAGGVEPAMKWVNIGGAGLPQDNATRNVYRGEWELSIVYAAGDIVMDPSGYGWSCKVAHTSSVNNKLPIYPIKNNTLWELYAVKGGDSLTGLLSNETATVAVAYDGAISPAVLAVQASGVFSLYLGSGLVAPGSIVFTLGAVVGCTATLNAAGEYALTTMTADNASVSMVATYGAAVVTKEFTVAKSFPAVSYDVELESTNGTFFRVGQATTTVIKAKVYRNSQEVTLELPTSAFKWTRVSAIPRESPYDDATWNAAYIQGYKQISVSVDDVQARATFFCQISI